MEFFKGLALASLISAGIWYGIIQTSYNMGYEEGKSYQRYVDASRPESCQKLAGAWE